MAARRHTASAGADGVTGRPTVGHETTYLVEVLGMRRPVAITGGREDRVSAIAGLQRGRVSRDQLRAAGIPDRTISRLAANGFLRRVYRAVYAVGHTAPAPLTAETEALLACGAHSVLSHETAARMWRLLPEWDTTIHVTIRGRHGPRPPGVHVHRASSLNRSEVRVLEGLLATSPLRTLLDLAATIDLPTLERVVEEALVQKLVTERKLRQAIRGKAGRRGIPKLRAILEQHREPGITRSEAERRMRRLIRAAQLPEPLTNARVHGFSVDFYWPDLGVVVEVQSHRFHLTKAALERDTRKAAKLTAAGLTISYVTYLQMRDEPFAVVARLAQLLTRAAAAGPARQPAVDLPLAARPAR